MSALALPKDLAQLFLKFKLRAEDCLRRDGRYSLPYDGGRLDIHLVRRGCLLLETSLVALPAETAARRSLLERALKFSTARMKMHRDTLAQTPAGEELVLQCDTASNGPVHELEAVIEQFLNSADRWRKVLNTP